MPEIDTLTHESFSQRLGDIFRIALQSGQHLNLELIEAAALPAQGKASRAQPFTLLFKSEESGFLPQNTYRLQHEKMGELDIFLVPVGPDKNGQGMCYESIFN
jgi:hypothetical protein